MDKGVLIPKTLKMLDLILHLVEASLIGSICICDH